MKDEIQTKFQICFSYYLGFPVLSRCLQGFLVKLFKVHLFVHFVCLCVCVCVYIQYHIVCFVRVCVCTSMFVCVHMRMFECVFVCVCVCNNCYMNRLYYISALLCVH